MRRLSWILPLVMVAGLTTSTWAKGGKQQIRRLSPQAEARKFNRVAGFATRYQAFTSRINQTLRQPKLTRDVAVAAIATIMKSTSMRVGSECYATPRDPSKKKPSFGASSLRKEHVTVTGNTVHFRFRGKSGVNWNRKITNPQLAQTVQMFLAQPGQRLWQVPGRQGKMTAVTERHVGKLFSEYQAQPKDLRTYLANTRYSTEIAKFPSPKSKAEAVRFQGEAIKNVAKFMGHKPATCKTSYLNPSTLQQYAAGL